jgi:hypothetical protein
MTRTESLIVAMAKALCRARGELRPDTTWEEFNRNALGQADYGRYLARVALKAAKAEGMVFKNDKAECHWNIYPYPICAYEEIEL